jgi:hypothetical protein
MPDTYAQFMDRLIAASARAKAIEDGKVDPDRAALDSTVRMYMDAHPGVSSPDALDRVLAEED